MIPLITFYYDYIIQSELTEQKKPFKHVVPAPTKTSRYKQNYKYQVYIILPTFSQLMIIGLSVLVG